MKKKLGTVMHNLSSRNITVLICIVRPLKSCTFYANFQSFQALALTHNLSVMYICLVNYIYLSVIGSSPNVKVKECGSQTGLHVAAAYGSVAALHILVMAGATLDMTDNQLMTPLMIAITKEQNEVVHYLVQAGASLMAKVSMPKLCRHIQ